MGRASRAAHLPSFEIEPAIRCDCGQPTLEGALAAIFFQQARPFLRAGLTIGPNLRQDVLRLRATGAPSHQNTDQFLVSLVSKLNQLLGWSIPLYIDGPSKLVRAGGHPNSLTAELATFAIQNRVRTYPRESSGVCCRT